MGIVPDRHAELIMADPALLKLASKRFPDRAPIADAAGSALYRVRPLRDEANRPRASRRLDPARYRGIRREELFS